MDDSNLVTVTCSNMRSWGRQALAGRWSTAVAGTLLLAVLTVLPVLLFNLLFDSRSLDYISNLYGMLVSGPLTLGYITFILTMFRRREVSPVEVLYGFERFAKALGLMIVVNVLILLWSLLLIIPGIIASFRYAMVFYVLADHPEMGIFDIIRESSRLMRGNKWKYFCLELSFIGWILLALLTAGIGYLWLMPYMIATSAGFYEVANGNLRPYYPGLSSDTTGEDPFSAGNPDEEL